jgi:hypothetical protein
MASTFRYLLVRLCSILPIIDVSSLAIIDTFEQGLGKNTEMSRSSERHGRSSAAVP